MPERLTISNTSPLLYLHLVGQLDLLKRLYGEVVVPPAVEAELRAGAERGIDVPEIASQPWLKVIPLGSDTSIPLVTDLGRGEAEVIALGLEKPDSRLLLDDTLARRIARLHGLRFAGTVGIIVKAKQVGLLPAASPLISALREAGLWLSDNLVAEVLRQAGEG
jgi:predicted nucleic acid-binding protein